MWMGGSVHGNIVCSERYCRRAALKRMTRDIKEDADEERRLNAKKSDGMDNVFLGNNRQVFKLKTSFDLFRQRQTDRQIHLVVVVQKDARRHGDDRRPCIHWKVAVCSRSCPSSV